MKKTWTQNAGENEICKELTNTNAKKRKERANDEETVGQKEEEVKITKKGNRTIEGNRESKRKKNMKKETRT